MLSFFYETPPTNCTLFEISSYQGHIEPPKAARGRATYIDSKILSVTKYSSACTIDTSVIV